MQATHISEEPLICPSEFEHEGLRDQLTIGSYHLSASKSGHALWVLMGIGDAFACRYPIPLKKVKWAKFAVAQDQQADAHANISVITVLQDVLRVEGLGR